MLRYAAEINALSLVSANLALGNQLRTKNVAVLQVVLLIIVERKGLVEGK